MVDSSKLKSDIEKNVKENFIMIYSKSYCPYCKATKSLISQLTADFPADKKVKIIELDEVDSGSDIQNILADSVTHQRSVPQVFINSEFIGGNDKLQSLKGKVLDQKLAAPVKA